MERSGNFPKSYVESSHRREWFQERFGKDSESSDKSELSENVSETPVENIEVVDEPTPVETINNLTDDERTHSPDDQEMMDVDEVMSVVLEEVVAPESPKVEVLKADVEEIDITQDAKGDEVTLVETLSPENEDIEESSEGAVGGQVELTEEVSRTDNSSTHKLKVDLLSEQVFSEGF